MLEKLRDNPRVVIAVLVTAGLLAFAIGNSNNNNNQDTEQTETATPEVVVNDDEVANEEAVEAEAEADSDDQAVGTEPEAGAVDVQKQDNSYRAAVRKGDSQTVVVRQMVSDYSGEQSAELSAEQRLYMETVIVNSLPRNDLVFTGQEIVVDEATVSSAADGARNLTEAQLTMWAQYL